MRKVLLLCCFLSMATSSMGWEIDKKIFSGHAVAMVIYNRSTGDVWRSDPLLAERRLSPCSTFKIYNTLIGLETGLISGADEAWYAWDGVLRSFEGWNRDLTLREAFNVSAVPAYQILARQIGPERMEKYLDEISYGNRDISSGVDVFWLYRPGQGITISAYEQVLLLDRLLEGDMPFSAKMIGLLKDVMRVLETERGTLYGKTGSGMNADGKWSLGWFVGFLEHGPETYVFACNVTEGESPSGQVARRIVEDVFKKQGFL